MLKVNAHATTEMIISAFTVPSQCMCMKLINVFLVAMCSEVEVQTASLQRASVETNMP